MTVEDSDKVDKIVIEHARTERPCSPSAITCLGMSTEGRHLELLQTKVYRYLDPSLSPGELYRGACP